MNEATRALINPNDQELKDANGGQSCGTILMDFGAPWCNSCNMMEPIVDDITKKFDGKVNVVEVNTDENHELAKQYNIQSIPTMIALQDGKPVDTMVGAKPKNALQDMLSKHA